MLKELSDSVLVIPNYNLTGQELERLQYVFSKLDQDLKVNIILGLDLNNSQVLSTTGNREVLLTYAYMTDLEQLRQEDTDFCKFENIVYQNNLQLTYKDLIYGGYIDTNAEYVEGYDVLDIVASNVKTYIKSSKLIIDVGKKDISYIPKLPSTFKPQVVIMIRGWELLVYVNGQEVRKNYIGL